MRYVSVFEVTGVDLARPILLKERKKFWIIMFICAAYGAIYLKLVTSLSTNGFLLDLEDLFLVSVFRDVPH